MSVLMLSTDKNVFHPDSAVAKRLIEYGNLFDRLDMIVYTKASDGHSVTKLSDKITLYPTRTNFKIFYFRDAYRIGKSLIGISAITAQDPFETGLTGYLLKKKFKAPLQLQIHTDFLSSWFAKESFKNKVRVVLARWLITKADGFRVVSERIRRSLLDLGITAKPIEVLPIWLDLRTLMEAKPRMNLHSKYPGYEFIILAMTRFTKEKNIQLAIQAMREVINRYPKTLLLLVGDGPESVSLKLLVKSYQLEESVIFEPWVSDPVSYYKTSDLFILTSNYEGGARAPAEAVAAGLPVVMTDVAPAGEIVLDGKNGFVVPVGNSRILAEKIGDLIKDPELQKQFREESGKIADRFPSREEYLKRYRASITDLLSAGI